MRARTRSGARSRTKGGSEHRQRSRSGRSRAGSGRPRTDSSGRPRTDSSGRRTKAHVVRHASAGANESRDKTPIIARHASAGANEGEDLSLHELIQSSPAVVTHASSDGSTPSSVLTTNLLDSDRQLAAAMFGMHAGSERPAHAAVPSASSAVPRARRSRSRTRGSPEHAHARSASVGSSVPAPGPAPASTAASASASASAAAAAAAGRSSSHRPSRRSRTPPRTTRRTNSNGPASARTTLASGRAGSGRDGPDVNYQGNVPAESSPADFGASLRQRRHSAVTIQKMLRAVQARGGLKQTRDAGRPMHKLKQDVLDRHSGKLVKALLGGGLGTVLDPSLNLVPCMDPIEQQELHKHMKNQERERVLHGNSTSSHSHGGTAQGGGDGTPGLNPREGARHLIKRLREHADGWDQLLALLHHPAMGAPGTQLAQELEKSRMESSLKLSRGKSRHSDASENVGRAWRNVSKRGDKSSRTGFLEAGRGTSSDAIGFAADELLGSRAIRRKKSEHEWVNAPTVAAQAASVALHAATAAHMAADKAEGWAAWAPTVALDMQQGKKFLLSQRLHGQEQAIQARQRAESAFFQDFFGLRDAKLARDAAASIAHVAASAAAVAAHEATRAARRANHTQAVQLAEAAALAASHAAAAAAAASVSAKAVVAKAQAVTTDALSSHRGDAHNSPKVSGGTSDKPGMQRGMSVLHGIVPHLAKGSSDVWESIRSNGGIEGHVETLRTSLDNLADSVVEEAEEDDSADEANGRKRGSRRPTAVISSDMARALDKSIAAEDYNEPRRRRARTKRGEEDEQHMMVRPGHVFNVADCFEDFFQSKVAGREKALAAHEASALRFFVLRLRCGHDVKLDVSEVSRRVESTIGVVKLAVVVDADARADSEARQSGDGDDWEECTDDATGAKYWYSRQRSISAWERPAPVLEEAATGGTGAQSCVHRNYSWVAAVHSHDKHFFNVLPVHDRLRDAFPELSDARGSLVVEDAVSWDALAWEIVRLLLLNAREADTSHSAVLAPLDLTRHRSRRALGLARLSPATLVDMVENDLHGDIATAKHVEAAALLKAAINADSTMPGAELVDMGQHTDHPNTDIELESDKRVAKLGWTVLVDESNGEKYYWNEATDETRWDLPAEADQPKGDMEATNGWTKTWSEEEGAFYWWNEGTGETTWDDPTGTSGVSGGWIMLLDDATGDSYYFNETTGETSWDAPPDFGKSQPQSETAASTSADVTAAQLPELSAWTRQEAAPAADESKRKGSSRRGSTLRALAAENAAAASQAGAQMSDWVQAWSAKDGRLCWRRTAVNGDVEERFAMPAVAQGSVMGHDPSFALDVVHAIIQSVPSDGIVMLSRAMRAVRAMSIAPLHDPTAVADIFAVVDGDVKRGEDFVRALAAILQRIVEDVSRSEVAGDQGLAQNAVGDDVVRDALCCVANVAFTSERARHLLCELCVDSVLKLLTHFQSNLPTVHAALRALGNLSIDDVNVPTLIKAGVVGTIVLVTAPMANGAISGSSQDAQHARQASEVLEIALQVLANLASLEQDTACSVVDHKGHTRRFKTTRLAVLRQGTLGLSVAVLQREPAATTLCEEALDLLTNLAFDEDTAAIIVKDKRVVSALTGLLLNRSYTYHDAVVLKTARALASLLRFSPVSDQVRAPQAHARAWISDAGVIKRLAVLLDECNAALRTVAYYDSEADNDLVHLLDRLVLILAQLAEYSPLSSAVAQEAGAALGRVAHTHKREEYLMCLYFRLVSNLAVLEENARWAKRHEMIQPVLAAARWHVGLPTAPGVEQLETGTLQSAEAMALAALKCVEDMGLGGAPWANAVLEAGGEKFVEELRDGFCERVSRQNTKSTPEKSGVDGVEDSLLGSQALMDAVERVHKAAQQAMLAVRAARTITKLGEDIQGHNNRIQNHHKAVREYRAGDKLLPSGFEHDVKDPWYNLSEFKTMLRSGVDAVEVDQHDHQHELIISVSEDLKSLIIKSRKRRLHAEHVQHLELHNLTSVILGLPGVPVVDSASGSGRADGADDTARERNKSTWGRLRAVKSFLGSSKGGFPANVAPQCMHIISSEASWCKVFKLSDATLAKRWVRGLGAVLKQQKRKMPRRTSRLITSGSIAHQRAQSVGSGLASVQESVPVTSPSTPLSASVGGISALTSQLVGNRGSDHHSGGHTRMISDAVGMQVRSQPSRKGASPLSSGTTDHTATPVREARSSSRLEALASAMQVEDDLMRQRTLGSASQATDGTGGARKPSGSRKAAYPSTRTRSSSASRSRAGSANVPRKTRARSKGSRPPPPKGTPPKPTG